MGRMHNSAVWFTDFADQNKKGNADETVVFPENLGELSVEELQELRTKAAGAFDTIYADGSGFTSDDVQVLSDLTAGIESLQAELANREAQAAELAAQAAELAAKVKGVEPEEEPVEEVPVDAPVEEVPADAPAAMAAEPVEPTEPADRTINLASAARRRSSRPAPAPAPAPAAAKKPGVRDLVTAAVGVGAYAAGQGMDWSDVGRVIDHRLNGFSLSQYENAARTGTHLRQEFSIANIRKPIPEHLMIREDSVEAAERVMKMAMDEHRLPGGSLVAAGGWCAPSETKYEFCELETTAGLISVPEVGVSRGGIRRTLGPNFSDIFTNTGFSFTEAQDIAGNYSGGANTPKPCYTVECPAFEDIRLAAAGLCISAGLLMAKGYPELIARVVRGALVAHDHKMSQRVIAAIEAGSTAATISTTGQGVTTSVLSSVELIIESIRQDNRLAENATVEVVLPMWARAAMRADLALRQGVDLISVSNSRLDAYLRERGANVQYVNNWQPLVKTGNVPSYPTTLKFLAYPAGTWVRGTSDIINLDTIYDSVNLSKNNYIALFAEEGWFAAKMCHDSRVATVNLCVNGAVGAAVEIVCA